MQLFFREAITTDAEALLEYLKKVGSESEYLSFGKEGIGLTISEEETFLSRTQIAITSWTPRGKNLGHGWSRRIYP